MWDFLSPLASDPITAIAVWATVAAGVAAAALFFGTLLLRSVTVVRARRRRSIVGEWRGIFASAMCSANAARSSALPPLRSWSHRYLLDEWTRIAGTIRGESAKNVVVLAGRIGLDRTARRLLQHRDLHDRLLAIQTLGHLGDVSVWDTLASLVRHANASLAATAALALVRIDSSSAMSEIMPAVIERADLPPPTVFLILKTAGSALITQPLCHAILTADTDTAVRLLRYAELAQRERMEDLIEVVLRERIEPAVLAAAMRASESQAGVPRIESLARHEDWYVRVQAVRLLGRVGSRRDLPVLERLLSDREWWVRYRAAQSIVRLPFMGPNELRQLAFRQDDDFARDMMQQAMAEVSLA